MQYSIGEFSRITQISIKALRLYHEKGILLPSFIDPESGYRYYDAVQIGEAQVIAQMKELGFSLSEIGDALSRCSRDEELLDFLRSKRRELERRVVRFQESIAEIEFLISGQGLSEALLPEKRDVESKTLPDLLVAGYRMKGRYNEVGKGFRMLGRKAGRYCKGKPMCLYHDLEYKESDADFEACFEVNKVVSKGVVESRELPGGPALTTIFEGPYEKLSGSYARLFSELKSEDCRLVGPIRLVFHRGPGLILRGNPQKYLTEIQFPVG